MRRVSLGAEIIFDLAGRAVRFINGQYRRQNSYSLMALIIARSDGVLYQCQDCSNYGL